MSEKNSFVEHPFLTPEQVTWLNSQQSAEIGIIGLHQKLQGRRRAIRAYPPRIETLTPDELKMMPQRVTPINEATNQQEERQ